MPTGKLAVFRQTVFAEVEKIREFEEASNVRVDIRSTPLTDEARLHDALKLISLQGPTDELKAMARGYLARA